MIEMATGVRRALEEYLTLAYPFEALADPDGGYVVRFPDLPGCITQVETLEELAAAAEEARNLWIETEYELGRDIPLPSQPEEYSGKFNVRIPRALHRSLAEAARRNNVSLNHYVSDLLARGDAQAQIERHLQDLTQQIAQLGRTGRSPVTSLR
jgi:predicted RNase H-like HicB family nuclease